jgi:hypothetical protein
MDYAKLIKSLLDEANFVKLLEHLNLDKELLAGNVISGKVANIVCSNSSYVFVYLEQVASILAISLNKLCKSNDESNCLLVNSVQVKQLFQCF